MVLSLLEARSKGLFGHLRRSVDTLDLSVRTHRCLENHGVMTVWETCQKTEVHLLQTKNFDRGNLNELKEVLYYLGLSLGMEFDEDLISALREPTPLSGPMVQ